VDAKLNAILPSGMDFRHKKLLSLPAAALQEFINAEKNQ